MSDLQAEMDLACAVSNLRDAALRCEAAIQLTGERQTVALQSAEHLIRRSADVLYRIRERQLERRVMLGLVTHK